MLAEFTLVIIIRLGDRGLCGFGESRKKMRKLYIDIERKNAESNSEGACLDGDDRLHRTPPPEAPARCGAPSTSPVRCADLLAFCCLFWPSSRVPHLLDVTTSLQTAGGRDNSTFVFLGPTFSGRLERWRSHRLVAGQDSARSSTAVKEFMQRFRPTASIAVRRPPPLLAIVTSLAA